MLGVIASYQTASARHEASKEYQVKAAFLYNFGKFVEWPAEPPADSGNFFAVCILGRDPFGSALEEIMGGESIREHPILIRRAQEPSDLKSCHLLFISSSEQNRLPEILRTVGGMGVLTVGETPGFTQNGGIIGLMLKNNKIRFTINTAAAKQAGLKLSSQLLNLGL
jgi:hypothetical protein